MLHNNYEPYLYISGVLLVLLLLWYFYKDVIPLDDTVCYVNDQDINIKNTPIIKDDFRDDIVAEVQEDIPVDVPAEICIPPLIDTPKSKKFVSKGERECRRVMEEFYGVKFDSIRPNWLKNPETGCNLELDCYNDELKLAVEYNGEQHYNWPNYTNQTFEQFINQTRRDIYKKKVCDLRGIYLISVPYLIPIPKIKEYILSQLPENIPQ